MYSIGTARLATVCHVPISSSAVTGHIPYFKRNRHNESFSWDSALRLRSTVNGRCYGKDQIASDGKELMSWVMGEHGIVGWFIMFASHFCDFAKPFQFNSGYVYSGCPSVSMAPSPTQPCLTWYAASPHITPNCRTLKSMHYAQDGTLTDSITAPEAAWARVAQEIGADPVFVIAATHSKRAIDNLARFKPHLHPHELSAAVDDFERSIVFYADA